MGHQDEAREWEEHAGLRAQLGDGDRYFNAWMGSILQRHPNWGTMVGSRALASQKLPRVAGSHLCREIIREGQESPHSSENGQQNCCVLCGPHGRHAVTPDELTCDSALAVVPREEPLPISKLCCRRGVQDHSILSRVAPGPEDILKDSRDLGGMQYGPVCYTAQHPVGAVCQLEAGPECNKDRCTPNLLGQSLRIRIPTILLDWQQPQEGQGGESTSVIDTSSVEVPAVIPSTAGTAGGLSTESTEQPNATDRPIWQSSPPFGSRPTTTSCLEVIRQQQQEFWEKLQSS